MGGKGKKGFETSEEDLVISHVRVRAANGWQQPGKESSVGLMQDVFGTMIFLGERRVLERVRASGCRRCPDGQIIDPDEMPELLPGDQLQVAVCIPRRIGENGERLCRFTRKKQDDE